MDDMSKKFEKYSMLFLAIIGIVMPIWQFQKRITVMESAQLYQHEELLRLVKSVDELIRKPTPICEHK